MFLVGWAASDVGVKLMNTWLTETRLAAQLQQFSCFRIGGGASMQTVMDKIMKTLSHELTNVSLSAKSGVICSGLMIFGVCRSLIQFVAICWFFVVTLCLDCISFVFLFDVIVIDRLSWNSAVSCMALLCWRSSMSTPSSRIFLGWMIMMNWPVSCNTVRRFASRSLRFGLIAEGFLIEDSDECHWFWCMPRLMTCWFELNNTVWKNAEICNNARSYRSLGLENLPRVFWQLSSGTWQSWQFAWRGKMLRKLFGSGHETLAIKMISIKFLH